MTCRPAKVRSLARQLGLTLRTHGADGHQTFSLWRPAGPDEFGADVPLVRGCSLEQIEIWLGCRSSRKPVVVGATLEEIERLVAELTGERP